MKAAPAISPRCLVGVEVDPIGASAESVRIKAETVGLCATDVGLLRGDHPYSRFPMIQGHEVAGTAIEDPSGVLEVGKPVVVDPILACGMCRICQRRGHHYCPNLLTMGLDVPGGLQEEMTVLGTNVHRIDGLGADVGSLVESLAVAIHAVDRARIVRGQDVLVIGAGPIGLLVTLVCGERGARVFVVGRRRARLEIARSFGAETVVDENECDSGFVNSLDFCQPRAVGGSTGNATATSWAFDRVEPGGIIAIVGNSARNLLRSVSDIVKKEFTVLGVRNSGLDGFAKAIRIAPTIAAPLRQIVTHRFPFDDTARAFELAVARSEVVSKIAIEFEAA